MVSSLLAGLSAFLQWGCGFFKAKNAPDVKRAAVAAQDEATLQQANADLAKGDPKQLGADIAP